MLRVPLINVVLIMIMADGASCCTVERKGATSKELMNSVWPALRHSELHFLSCSAQIMRYNYKYGHLS